MLNEAVMAYGSYRDHLGRSAGKPSDYSQRLEQILLSGQAKVVAVGYDVVYQNNKGTQFRTSTRQRLDKSTTVFFDPRSAETRALRASVHDGVKVAPWFSVASKSPSYIPVVNFSNKQAINRFLATKIADLRGGGKVVSATPWFTVDFLDKDANLFKAEAKKFNEGDIYEIVFAFAVTAFLMEGVVSPGTLFRMVRHFLSSTNGQLSGQRVRMGYNIVPVSGKLERRFNDSSTSNNTSQTGEDAKDVVRFWVALGKLKSADSLNEFFSQSGLETNATLSGQIANTQTLMAQIPKFSLAHERLDSLMSNGQVDAVRVSTTNSASETEQSMKMDVGVNIGFYKRNVRPDGTVGLEPIPQQSINVSLKTDSAQLESASVIGMNQKLNQMFQLGLSPRDFADTSLVFQLGLFSRKVAPSLDGRVFTGNKAKEFLRNAFRFVEQDDIPILIKAASQKTMDPGWFEYLYKNLKSVKFEVDTTGKLVSYANVGNGYQPLIQLRPRTEGQTKRLSIDVESKSVLYTPATWTNDQEVDHAFDKYLRILNQLRAIDLREFVATEKRQLDAGDAEAQSGKPTKKVLTPITVLRASSFRKMWFRVSRVVESFRSTVAHSLPTVGPTDPGLQQVIASLTTLQSALDSLLKDQTVFSNAMDRQLAGQSGEITTTVLAVQAALNATSQSLATNSGVDALSNLVKSFGVTLGEMSTELQTEFRSS